MSYDLKEKSTASGQPFELYLFEGTGVSESLTSHDAEIDYLLHQFLPATISRTEIDKSAEVTTGQIKVYLPSDHPVARLFVPYLPTSPIALTIYGGHVGDPDIFVVFSGSVASGHFTDQCELVCNSDEYRLQSSVPRIPYQSPCAHIFGDVNCGVDLGSVTYTGTVAAISADGTQVTVTEFDPLPHSLRAGYFKRGNDLRMIVDHTGDVITLISGIADLEIGDACFGTAGCQHTYSDCASFLNVSNFLGFDLIPLLNPFDGSVT